MTSLKPSQVMTLIGMCGAAISAGLALTFGPLVGLIVADIVLVANTAAPYLTQIGD